jgi:hypothetical protein
MRTLMMSAALAALLAACSPPSPRDAEAPSPSPPTVQACNAIQPDLTKLVRVEEELAVASAASDLRGGVITPGVYDLTRAVRIGQATGWQGERAVALSIAEEANGPLTFNWAGAAPGGAVDTWTASFTDVAQQGQFTYTCGRTGQVLAGFATSGNTLQLRVPDGANGSLQLDFARRP